MSKLKPTEKKSIGTEIPFEVVFENFHDGFSPIAHLDNLTEIGSSGMASAMQNVDIISEPGHITQGPALSDLTNGNQASVVYEVVSFIMDRPASDGKTYGIGPTKLFQISSTTVTSSASWPHIITGSTAGKSCIAFQGSLYYFHNGASNGNIGKFDLSSTFNDSWGSDTPTGATYLVTGVGHPVATKEDIMLFGNGRYVGKFTNSTTTLEATKLDFGANTEVADICFHANQWWIAVNSGDTTGVGRCSASIYLYDGAALSSILFDEVAVGVQQVGFIIPINGVIYACIKDLSGANVLGLINGRAFKPLVYFNGNLPTYQKKTLYKNFLMFESSGLIYSAGAATPSLPFTLAQFCDGGYATCGGIAAPFGTLWIASTDGGSNQRLAKVSGYDTNCNWKSVVVPTVRGRMIGYIDAIVVITDSLGANARCDITIQTEDATVSGTANAITTAGKMRHVFTTIGLGQMHNFRVFLDWSNGNSTNNCNIKEIHVIGHMVQA